MTRFTTALLMLALVAVLLPAPAAAQDGLIDELRTNWSADDLIDRTAKILGGAGGGFAGYLVAAGLAGAGLSVGLPVTVALVGGGMLAGYLAGPWLADKFFGAGRKNDWPIDGPSNRAAATVPREGISLLGLGR